MRSTTVLHRTLLTLYISVFILKTDSALKQRGLTDKFSHLIQPSKNSNYQREDIIKNLETTLLNMFGFSERPKPSGKINVPDYMVELYDKHLKGEENLLNFNVEGYSTRSANTVRGFHHIEDVNQRQSHRHRLVFNITTIPDQEVVTAAELRLFRDQIPQHSIRKRFAHINSQNMTRHHTHQRINLYQILKPSSDDMNLIKRLIDTVVIDVRDSTWESLDAQLAVKSWKNQPNTNHGLEVEIVDLEGTEPSHGHAHMRLKRRTPENVIGNSEGNEEEENTWLKERPLLVAYTDDGRTKRSTKRLKRNKGKNRKLRLNCYREALYVDFNNVGWDDWIVAPPGYQAFFCQGECPFPLPDHVNSTNHAIVQTIMNSANPSRIPKACCVPTELGPINMLYIDEQGHIVLKNYKEMVVTSCGCR